MGARHPQQTQAPRCPPRQPAPSRDASARALSRREQLLLGAAALLAAGAPPRPAAAALMQFPSAALHNRYFLLRAGQSEAEADGYTLTNPVWKTSMRCGLSRLGKQQVGERARSRRRRARHRAATAPPRCPGGHSWSRLPAAGGAAHGAAAGEPGWG
jgi:hypothetical protein